MSEKIFDINVNTTYWMKQLGIDEYSSYHGSKLSIETLNEVVFLVYQGFNGKEYYNIAGVQFFKPAER